MVITGSRNEGEKKRRGRGREQDLSENQGKKQQKQIHKGFEY
jgi:hypothetical protein